MEEWKECKLGDFFELHRGYDLTKSEIKTGPYPVVCSTSIMGYHSEYKVRAPGVVIGRSGTLGEVQFIDKDFWPHNTSLYVSDFKGNSPKFIKYFLQLFGTGNVGGGSAVPTLNRNHLQALAVKVPPLPTQQKIADILSSLDDKIELNNKINTNLEQQAGALFKNWFANKIDNVSEKDGSALGTLIDIVDNRGKTPPSSNEKNDFPILDVGALNSTGRIINYKNCTKYVDEQTYSTFFRDGHPQDNDILISTVGSLAQMKFFKGNKGCIAQNVVAFRTLNTSPFYLYEYLKFIKNDLLAYDIGSVQPSIKVTHIIKHLIYIPTNDELANFDSFAKSITEQIYNNVCENERLISIRDTLLPKLMYGEIEV